MFPDSFKSGYLCLPFRKETEIKILAQSRSGSTRQTEDHGKVKFGAKKSGFLERMARPAFES